MIDLEEDHRARAATRLLVGITDPVEAAVAVCALSNRWVYPWAVIMVFHDALLPVVTDPLSKTLLCAVRNAIDEMAAAGLLEESKDRRLVHVNRWVKTVLLERLAPDQTALRKRIGSLGGS